MKTRNLSILLAALFVIAGSIIAAGARAANEVPAPPAIGSTIEDFTLPDVDNKDHSLKSLAGVVLSPCGLCAREWSSCGRTPLSCH